MGFFFFLTFFFSFKKKIKNNNFTKKLFRKIIINRSPLFTVCMPRSLVDLELSLFVIYQARAHTHIPNIHSHKDLNFNFLSSLFTTYIRTIIQTHYRDVYIKIYIEILLLFLISISLFCLSILLSLFSVSLPVCDKMPNIKIFQLLPDDKDIAAMQQPESLLVPSKPDSPDSSLSPRHQENQSKRHPNHQQQDQEHEQVQEQEKLQDGSRRKRKWECDDEASRVETPRKSNIRSTYSPPRPPRKPKATPAMKGRAMWLKRSVVFVDVARDVESMFPPSVLQDFGKKIKKATS